MPDSGVTVSVVVPCYNEAEVLPQLFDRLTRVAATWGGDYEVMCVNDGSTDRTWDLLVAQNAKDARWKGISFSRNFGHQTAVSAGVQYCQGNAVIIIDADLQDPPEVIARLLDLWRQGFQVVHAVRTKRSDPWFKRFLAWGFYRLLAKMVSIPLPKDAGDFCLLDRRVVEVLKTLPERSRYLRGLRGWCGFRHTVVEFERQPRAAGQAQYSFTQSLKLALDGMVSFSTAPLRLATWLGFCVSLFAFFGAVFTFCQKVFSAQFAALGLAPGPGFPTIVISILFLGGVQLICLGILGEYIGRIYDEVKGRPLWVIGDSVGVKLPAGRLEESQVTRP